MAKPTKHPSHMFKSIIPSELEYREHKPKAKKEADIDSLAKRKSDNERLPCAVIGCEHLRYGVSRYCRHHKQHAQRTGHPTLTAPNKAQLDWLKQEGAKLLQYLYDRHSKERVDIWLNVAAKRLVLSPSPWLIPIHKIDRLLNQKSQATVILAHFQHERHSDSEGNTYIRDRNNELTEALKAYLFSYLYILRMDLISGPSTREDWVNTHVGRYIKRKSNMNTTRSIIQRKGTEIPSWYIGEDGKRGGYRYEDHEVEIKDTFDPPKSVIKALGRMVQEACSREGLLTEVNAYYQYQLQINQADPPTELVDGTWSHKRMSLDEWNTKPEVSQATLKCR